ncbi:MAG: hypothetical protein QOK04_1386 [Solirubrobacteraceae bacterium]|nr:hypothetical protein [Solirubrobacteraceae bacterium]MEA2160692.1 hypothetical protein [Solirubrobacteraceae bacterium]
MTSRQAVRVCGVGLAVLLSGCGSSGGASHPAIKGSLKKAVEQLNRAASTQSCRDYATVLATTRRPRGVKPGSPPTAAECKDYADVLARSLRGVRFGQAQAFGPAALAEGVGPSQGRYSSTLAIFVRDWDGRYRLNFSIVGDPQLKTKPRRGTNFGAQVDGFVRAVRSKDCKQLLAYVVPGSLTSGAAASTSTCRAVFGGKNLAPQLAADAKAKAVKFGETRDFGFYGLDTKRNYYTLILATRPSDQPRSAGSPAAGVFDYEPNKQPE